jgi:hypothetical protein
MSPVFGKHDEIASKSPIPRSKAAIQRFGSCHPAARVEMVDLRKTNRKNPLLTCSTMPLAVSEWVVGNEPVVVIDISGMVNYAKPA